MHLAPRDNIDCFLRFVLFFSLALNPRLVQLAMKNTYELLGRLPPEILRVIVGAAPCSLYGYLPLLGLSHAIRLSIRGTPSELSFAEPEPILSDIIRPTPDALAALVGPCKALRKLSFPAVEHWGLDAPRDAVADAGWVDEAFGGHTQLAVLAELPAFSEEINERILSHLPGLVELTVSPDFKMSPRLLAALARSCPGLQVLRCTASACDQLTFSALMSLSGVLKELALQDEHRMSFEDPEEDIAKVPSESLTVLVGSLTAVTSLKLPACPPAALEPIASHLTSLELGGGFLNEEGGLNDEKDLPGPRLCRLQALSLNVDSEPVTLMAPLTRLLAANQATLRSLALTLVNFEESLVPSLMAALRALPHLTELRLSVGAVCLGLLSAELVDRLERLDFLVNGIENEPAALASNRLQRLCLGGYPLSSGLTLRCPRLHALVLCSKISDKAPPMPDLEEAVFNVELDDPAWLLSGPALPRLRVLSGVRLTRPDLLASLCACGSLVRLEKLHLDVTRLPNPLVLRLPGQLERLDLHIGDGVRLDLEVEAPGLLEFSLAIQYSLAHSPEHLPMPHARVRLHNCPSLARLELKASRVFLLLQVDEDEAGMQPRSLMVVDSIDVAGLLDLLTRHGARLRTFTARGLSEKERWPQLTEALSRLPRLAHLDLHISGVPSPLSLSCPHLRTLTLPYYSQAVLACPLLEQLLGPRDPSRQVELALPAPNLRPSLRQQLDE
ncbi:hypothetical protein PAPYR_535 [Paratrimastix pyriformis]|uniref:Uncharacterized protein n=1 Tax=Paratrimastix pyriformis TaxID=342808 RepID=A0ABQ8UVS0_9EUKA|nr:hypothetical protein PAPYR_535 [Paratrimastix pyriformis]